MPYRFQIPVINSGNVMFYTYMSLFTTRGHQTTQGLQFLILPEGPLLGLKWLVWTSLHLRAAYISCLIPACSTGHCFAVCACVRACVRDCGWSPIGFVPVVLWIVFLLFLLHLDHHLQLSSQVSSITFTYTRTVHILVYAPLLCELPGLGFLCVFCCCFFTCAIAVIFLEVHSSAPFLFLFIPATFVLPCRSVYCAWFIKPTCFRVSSVFLGALA